MPFPNQVNVVQAPAIAGQFASRNPRASVNSLQGAFVAGAAGVTIAAFAWADPTNTILNSFGTGTPTGFVAREQQGTFTGFLLESGYGILPGSAVTAYSSGDYWVKNSGSGAVTVGMKAYVNNSNGSISFAATGSATQGATCTGGTLQKIVSAATGGALPTTNTCTGSISGTTLTVSAVGAGCALSPGQTLSGGSAGTNFVATGTSIVSQLTGSAGGVGTYQVSISQTVASTAVSMSGGTLTLTGANATGIFASGHTISGTNIPAGTTILAPISATAGGAGTYFVDRPATVAATASTITAANAMFLTVDASSSGTWALNDTIYGTTVTAQQIAANATINANLTGLGGAGTYLTNTYQASALTAQTISAYANTETKWYAATPGAAGELVIMSSHLLG